MVDAANPDDTTYDMTGEIAPVSTLGAEARRVGRILDALTVLVSEGIALSEHQVQVREALNEGIRRALQPLNEKQLVATEGAEQGAHGAG